MSKQATLKLRISQSFLLSEEAVRAFIAQNKKRFSNSQGFGPTSKLRVSGKNSKISSVNSMKFLLAAQRLDPTNPVYMSALESTTLGRQIVTEGSSVAQVIESQLLPETPPPSPPPSPPPTPPSPAVSMTLSDISDFPSSDDDASTGVDSTAPNTPVSTPFSRSENTPPTPLQLSAPRMTPPNTLAQDNAIKDSQGIVAQNNEVVAATQEIIKDVTEQITKDMGKPIYETEPNRGVGTEAMQTEKIGNNTFDQKVDSLGSVSEVPSAQYTMDSAMAQTDQIKSNIQTSFTSVQDPDYVGPINIIQQDTSNEGAFAEGSEQVSVIPVSNDTVGGVLPPRAVVSNIVPLATPVENQTPFVERFEGDPVFSGGDVVKEDTFAIPVAEEGTPLLQVDSVVPAGSSAGLQPTPQGYQAMYPVPIAIYFGSSSNPIWDTDLTASILNLVKNKQITAEQMLAETMCLHELYRCDLMIPTLKVTSSSDVSGVLRQYLEVIQLWSSLKRNLAQGKRVSSVGIPISQLQQFGSLLSQNSAGNPDLANATALPAADPQPDTPITQMEKAVNDSIIPSNTTKSILQGATPMSKRKYWKGSPRSSIAVTEQLDGLRRASVNRGANSKYGRAGSLTVPDDIRFPSMRRGKSVRNDNPQGSYRMGLSKKTDTTNNRIRL